MKTPAGAVAALMSGMLLTGCASTVPPTVEVQDARVVERTGDAAIVQLTVVARNDTDNPVPMKRVEYALAVGGRPVFSGVRSPEATIKPRSQQRFTIPAVARAGDIPAGEAPFMLTGVLTYTEPGKIAELLFENDVRQPTVNFSHQGTLNFGEAAR